MQFGMSDGLHTSILVLVAGYCLYGVEGLGYAAAGYAGLKMILGWWSNWR